MAVSGRFTAIVNRLRPGPNEDLHASSVSSVDPDELVAALRAMTLAELAPTSFGVGWALGGACPGVAFVQLGEDNSAPD
jgi:uncharacterized membrane protein YedE/YeeE